MTARIRDPRVLTIAETFCVGHMAPGAPPSAWPCAWCKNRAGNAVDRIDGLNPTIFNGDTPLSDPGENTPGKAPAAPTDTQEASRWAVRPKTGTQRRRILNVFFDSEYGTEGFTDDDLTEATRLSPSSVRPRRGELVAGGWLRDSGTRRASAAGNPAIVWELTPRAWSDFWRTAATA